MSSHESFGSFHHKLWQKERLRVKLAINSRPPKVGKRLDPQVYKWSATCHWKAFDESYKFASNLIPIGGLGKELWIRKVVGVQTGTVSGLPLGSPGIKNHSDVGVAERRKKYYMGEGGGFPRIRAVVSLHTKGAPESELTNLLIS